MQIGIYDKLDSNDYHDDKESISRSAIMDFKTTPFHYWARHLNPLRPRKEATPAMEFGTMFHTFILEEDEFDKRYCFEPEKVLLKNVGREQYDAYKAECASLEASGKQVISELDYNRLCEMRDAIYRNQQAYDLVQSAIYERSFFWKDEESGLIVKSRPDILHKNFVVDLKTISKGDARTFQQSMVSGGYHLQGAMNREAAKVLQGDDIKAFICLCVETSYPYCVSIYPIDEDALQYGRKEYKQTLLEIKDCMKSNLWPAYPIQTIGLPSWYTN